MKRKLFSLSIGIALLFSACIMLTVFSGSLWFLLSLLGDRPGEYTVGYYNSFLTSSWLAKSVKDQNKSFLPDITERYNRLVYKKDGRGEYLVGIPKVLNQISIQGELEQRGWEVRRIGWIVLASNTEASTPPEYSLMHALGKLLRMVTLDRLPIRPLIVFQLGRNEENNFSFYVEESNRGLHAVINTESPSFLGRESQRVAKGTVPLYFSYVALQRDVLSHLPSEFVVALERKISESMLFTKTYPRMVESLLPLGPVSLAIEGKNLAIGVFSLDPQPARLVNQWINAEQGTRHPTKKAFALPDKSLGYEYVPGLSNAYFNLNKGKNNCLPSEGYDENLFLCGKDQAVVFSNQENTANQLISLFQDKRMLQRGILQGSVMEAMGLNNQFERIEYVIMDETIEAWADVRQK